jgi:hypothetical protein
MEFNSINIPINAPTPAPVWHSNGDNQDSDSLFPSIIAVVMMVGFCYCVSKCIESYRRRHGSEERNTSILVPSIVDIESCDIEYNPKEFVLPPPYAEIVTTHPESPEATEVNALSGQTDIDRV